MLPPVTPFNPTIPATQAKDDPVKVMDAARQFEALLLSQMMKSMRDTEGGWMGTDEDDASSSAMEYGQEMFAQSMASQGGLGLAKLLAAGLSPETKNPGSVNDSATGTGVTEP
jgi:Rod binding domain-containing protein